MERFAEVFNGKRVLITGGLGFIGSNLALQLVKLGSVITVVDSLIPAYGGSIHNVRGFAHQLNINIADVRDPYSMNFLVRNQDFIFNLAGQVSHVLSMSDPYADLEINCRGQLVILEACRLNNPGVKIIYAGTRGEYGRAHFWPVNEDHPVSPIDINGVNKAAGERYHLLYHDLYGIRATSLRLTNTYGPRHTMKTADQSFLNWFIRLALDGQTIPVYGDGLQKRDFNYIDDVLEAFLIVASNEDSNGQVYNLGDHKPISVLDVTRLLLEISGSGSYELVPYPKERKSLEVGDYWGDFTKIHTRLGWSPVTTLQEGITKTIQFYRENKQYYWN